MQVKKKKRKENHPAVEFLVLRDPVTLSGTHNYIFNNPIGTCILIENARFYDDTFWYVLSFKNVIL